MRFPVLCPEHAAPPLHSSGRAPSLHTLRRRSSRPCSGASSVLRARPTPHPFPDGLPLGFPPRPGIARATAGRMRSPRFRRLPFVRDGVFDHGRASAPRITAPHMLPSALSTASASARLCLSRLNSPPRTIAVYASRRSSPSAPQHSLPSARYGLLGPDLHRLDPASFAWRTDSASFARSCSVSTRSAKRERRTRHETVSCTVTGHPECPRKPTYRMIRSPRTAEKSRSCVTRATALIATADAS